MLAVVIPTVQKWPLFLIEIQPLSSHLWVSHCQVSCAVQSCSTVDHFDSLAASNLLSSQFFIPFILSLNNLHSVLKQFPSKHIGQVCIRICFLYVHTLLRGISSMLCNSSGVLDKSETWQSKTVTFAYFTMCSVLSFTGFTHWFTR